MAAVIGALRGVLSLDSAAFDTGAKRARASMGDVERRMVRMGNSITNVGRKMTVGFTLPLAGAAAVAVRSSLQIVDAQAKTAQSLGTTVKSMQVLDRAADLSGVSMGEVQQATIQLTKRLSEAAGGTGEAAKALVRLRLDAEGLQKLPLDERLIKIQDALAQYVPEAERAAVATRLFGSRAGLIFTRIDSAALRIAADDVARFGIAVSDVDADQIERTNDAISRLGLIGRGVANQLAVGLAPVLENLSDGAASVGEWVGSASDRTRQFLAVGVAAAAAIGPLALGLGLMLKLTVPLVAGMAGLVVAVAKAPVVLALAAKSAVAMGLGFAGATVRAGVLAVSVGGLTTGLGALRLAILATGVGALIGVAAGVLAGFSRSREAAEEYAVAVQNLAGAHDVLNVATETFYANMTAKNAEAMHRAAQAARDATREALEAARAELDAASFTTNFFGKSLFETDRMAAARADIERLASALAVAEARLDAAAVAAERTADSAGEAADNIEGAAVATGPLAAGLGQASGQAAALSSFLSGLPGAIAGAQTNIAGLQAGISVLASGGGQAAANVAKYRAELEASVGPLEQVEESQRRAIEDGIEQRVTLYAQEQTLREEYGKQIAALSKVKSAGGAASRSAVGGVQDEIQFRKKLLTATDQQRQMLESVRSIQQRLGKDAKGLSKAQIDGLAAQVVELDNMEEALDRVNDLQRQWSEQITRTAFEGGSLGDTVKGMLRDIAYQFAHSRIVLPIVGSLTGILGLGGLLGGGGGGVAAATLAGGGIPGSGFLGGALGSGGLGGLIGGLGSTTGFLGGVGNVLGGFLGTGGTAGGLVGAFNGLAGSLAGATGSLAGAAAAIGAIAVPVAIVAGIFSFFRKKTKELDSGLRVTVSGMDALIQTFSRTETKRFWGLSKKQSTTYRTATASLADPLIQAVGDIQGGVMDAAKALGIGADTFEGFRYQFQVSTRGLSQEAAKAAVERAFKRFGNVFADMIPDLESYTRAGEDSLDAVTRLATGLTAVNDAMDMLDHTLIDVSLSGAAAASDLVDMFGGLDAMAASVNTYFGAFYSEGERNEIMLRRLRKQFTDLGVMMPQSREGFRELVEGLDLTTRYGRELYAGLMNLSGALSGVLPRVSQFTAEMSGLLGEIGGEIGTQIDTARSMAADALAAAQLWQRTAATLRDFVDGLVNTGLSGASQDQSAEILRGRYEAAFEAAKTGDVEAARNIPDLARAYLQSVQAGARSELEYRRVAAQVQGQIKLAAGIADLESANDDVLRGLYEQQIEVLTALGNFLQLDGLTDAQVGELSQGVQDLAADWDGTVAAFETSLGALESAIQNAEAFSYDDLVGRLDIAVALDDNAPRWLRDLVDKAETGIRTTLDFVIRRDDLTPDLRWLAVNSVSEHVKSLDFVLRKDVPKRLRKAVFATTSDLRRNIELILTKDLDADSRRIALAGNSTLSRNLTVSLDRDRSDPKALALSLAKAGRLSVSIRTALDISGLTDRQKALLDVIRDGSKGVVRLDGTFQFAPEQGFSGWYASTTKDLIATPMQRLSGMLDSLREQVQLDRQQRENQARLVRLQAVGLGVAESLEAKRGEAVALISDIKALERSTRVDIRDGASDALLETNERGGIAWRASHVSYGTGSNLAKFSDEFWAKGGMSDQIFETNAAIYGKIDRLEELRQMVREMGGVPTFAKGGFHMGGARLVGERGWEIENTGSSRIHSHAESVAMLDNRQVVKSVQELARQVGAQGQTLSMMVRRIARYLEDWDEAGQPEVRV